MISLLHRFGLEQYCIEDRQTVEISIFFGLKDIKKYIFRKNTKNLTFKLREKNIGQEIGYNFTGNHMQRNISNAILYNIIKE